MNWYKVKNDFEVDSPALLLYPDRIQHNIDCMKAQVNGATKRLFPHVKTHKMREVVQMQLAAGITKFKCSTIAELEMVLSTGAREAVLAYQLTGPKVQRFLSLVRQYPEANISSLVDNVISAIDIARKLATVHRVANVYLDVDNGMHRTGYPLDETTFDVVKVLNQIPNLNFKGLHVYDGQFRHPEVSKRQADSDAAFQPIYELIFRIKEELNISPVVISGGSPTFSSAAARPTVFCSPGTTLLWDYGYSQMVSEIPFQWAALVLTRVVSKPAKGRITLDLGHKSIASENPIDKRVHFLNLADYEVYKHSEEHLMVNVRDDWEAIQVGDIFYGVPFHICPTVALHQEAYIIRNNTWTDNWAVAARNRKLTV